MKVCLDGSEKPGEPPPGAFLPAAPDDGEAAYSGTVRVFLVEPLARWVDYNGDFYRYGFLSFPLVSNINMLDGDVVYRTGTWDASTTSIAEIFEENIMAIGVVFRSQGVPTDASPPEGYWFSAKYTDAAAAATPGVPGRSQASPPYTHPVFIQESTATS
ncbi:MAG: hypothetical protein AB1772_02680 [Candidatus Zixiibacteriota bacterium]